MLAIFIEVIFGKQIIERFSIEDRKTKAKVITLANYKGHRQSNEPIKIHVA